MKSIIFTVCSLVFSALSLHGGNEITKRDIGVVGIILMIGNEPKINLSLESDGTVMRQYSGPLFDGKYYTFRGHFNDEVFRKFMTEVDLAMLTKQMKYDLANKAGEVCDLKIIFGKNNEDVVAWHHYRYGTESAAPPPDVQNLAVRALELTEPWLEMQLEQFEKKRAEPLNSPKK